MSRVTEEKGAEMFAITLKQKELDLQTQLMENRIRKLQLEEERNLKTIS